MSSIKQSHHKEILQNYVPIVFLSYLIVIALRILELVLISFNFGFDINLFSAELTGLGYDFLFVNLLLALFYPFYYLLQTKKSILSDTLAILLIFSFIIAHFLILKSFLYQLIPLDIFLFQYSLQEVLFTIRTSNISYLKNIGLITTMLALVYASYRFLKKIDYSAGTFKSVYYTMLISLVIFIMLEVMHVKDLDKYSLNKTRFFAARSLNHFFKLDTKEDNYTAEDIKKFQNLYPGKNFINDEYPLIHTVKDKSGLKKYFNDFERAPNIVVLIVEGLNDDFIHEYKAAKLMPFLSDLKERSLYWNRCFTLGERSFAAVPSILGGLPYGEKGFSFLEKLPKHLSLLSILNSNKYYSSFFYGQGSWFHRKDRFFKYNDIDLIVDNSSFTEKYKKIIVGDDNFFWGYNDKDLFNQSFEVMDTLRSFKRMDVYFTGSSHSPYIIADDEQYQLKLDSLKNEGNHEFFDTYAKYLKSVLFVDDALRNFFTEYKKRDEYENTIFIITGDHPMTEVPIENSLKRYHVPLLFFSEKLKENKIFSNTVSHLDISQSVLSLLENNLKIYPSLSSTLGDELTVNNDQWKSVAFMNDNREIIDYYSSGYYLSDMQLYKVDEQLGIEEVFNNSIKSRMVEELHAFKKVSLHSSINNKIISNEDYCQTLKHTLLFSNINRDSNSFRTEYYNLTPEIEVKNGTVFFDIDFKYENRNSNNLSLVYQITNFRDSVLLWKNYGISKDLSIFQEHIKINSQKVKDSILHFKSYLWNKDQVEIKFSDINILMHTDSPNVP